MPADRRIVVQIQIEGYRDPALQGEFVPGHYVDHPRWASRKDVGQALKIESGGTRDATSRDWRIRWDATIAAMPTSLLRVIDGDMIFAIVNMVEVNQQRGEPDLRRKFLDLQGLAL